jgi:hypothetical protein
LLSEAKSNTHIICFSETLLSDSVIEGTEYENWGGGLLVYSSKELNTIRRDDLEMQEREAI